MALQQTLKVLSDPTRREILNLLKSGRLSAGEIADHFDITPRRRVPAPVRSEGCRPDLGHPGGKIHLL